MIECVCTMHYMPLQTFLAKERSLREDASLKLAASDARSVALAMQVEAAQQQLKHMQVCARWLLGHVLAMLFACCLSPTNLQHQDARCRYGCMAPCIEQSVPTNLSKDMCPAVYPGCAG